jgi:DNA-binding HxlR family transcriptional regulator
MEKRNYSQYCPLAYALDLVGERWTFLIIRELLYSPRRFTDLLNGLPGIGTNLLSKRLRMLEQEGLLTQRKLPPPAASTVYELSDRGRELVPVLQALADWGLPLLPPSPPDEDQVGLISTISLMSQLFSPHGPHFEALRAEIHSGDEIFYTLIDEGGIQTGHGHCNQPDLILQTPIRSFVLLLNGQLSPEAFLGAEGVKLIKGDPKSLGNFALMFANPQAQLATL